MILQELFGTEHTPGLFVGHREVDDVAGIPLAGSNDLAERNQHRRGQVQHVDRTTTPHLVDAVGRCDQLASERVVGPAVGVGGHDIGMGTQAQVGGVGVGALVAGDERDSAGFGLEQLKVHAVALEFVAEQFGAADLVARFGRAVVDALVSDQRLQQLDGLTGEDVDRCTHVSSWVARLPLDLRAPRRPEPCEGDGRGFRQPELLGV